MPRPARPWFRFYVEALHDRKLRRLSPSQRWLWVAVLGAARQSPVPGVLMLTEDEPMDTHDLADIAAMPEKHVAKALPLFESARMLARVDGTWRVINWSERQYESDKTTERTRKHRSKERRRNVPKSSEGTPPETETDKEPENKPPPTPPRGEREWISNGCTFEAFWDTYPRQAAEGTARKAWKQAVAKEGTPTPIVEGARRYANDPNLPELRFVPEPAKWLEAERWKDGPLPARGSSGSLADQLTAAAMRGDDGRG